MKKNTFLKNLIQTSGDFLKKCMDDNVGPFSANAAFFIFLSAFPFMIFFLTATRKIAYFSMNDLIMITERALSFENSSFIRRLFLEIYAKTGPGVTYVSIVTALWSSSKGFYTIIIGLNSVFDIEEKRNYFFLRFLGMIYTIVFGIVIILSLVLLVFGKIIKNKLVSFFPSMDHILSEVLQMRLVVSVMIMIVIFMLIYHVIPNRRSNFRSQFPGALIAALGWIIISEVFSILLDRFAGFNFIYGSMASITVLLLWLYWCMNMIFYGAEINYFLENKENYHELISVMRPRWERQRRAREKDLYEFTYTAQKRKIGKLFLGNQSSGQFDRTFDEFEYRRKKYLKELEDMTETGGNEDVPTQPPADL